MYFQYDNSGTPLGFIYNGVQYFYLTNTMGDVLGITEANGNLIAQYLYDDWGKLVSIDTADEEASTAYREIAEANPLRYCGYYYDNETGYYYLQSRYYDPEICRFINADVPEIAKVSKEVENGVNLFAYCNNDSVNNTDKDGYKPEWQTIADKGVSMSVVQRRLKEMKVKQRSYSKFKKANVYCVYQHYATKKWYNNEIYEMYTYGGKRSAWYNVIDSFKSALKKVDISAKVIKSSTFASLAAKVLKKSVKKINVFLSAAGIIYDFLVETANGVLDQIEKNIRNMKNSSYYVFNLYIAYSSHPLFGRPSRSIIYAYTPRVAMLYR